MTSNEQRLTELFARVSTQELVASLRTLDAQPPSPERNWSRAKTIEELERRFPAAAAIVGAAFDADNDDPIDYVALLLSAIPGSAQ
jgi:hypothetical protein